MSTLEASESLASIQPAVPSPDGKHIAIVNASRLDIRRVPSLAVVRSIDLLQPTSRYLSTRWGPTTKGAGLSSRVLVAHDDVVRVWDLLDPDWSATIDNGSGSLGKIANVTFGIDDTELIIFSSFAAKVTVWSLWTGKSVEIKNPKFASKGYGRNRLGRAGVFALLTRYAGQDNVTLHAPASYEAFKSISLPTADAQGLKWSPDGRWLAIWDAPSTGYKVLIYTADGNLYRTYRGDYFDDGLVGLGAKSVEWAPGGDFLLVCGYEKTLTILSTRTFSPAVQLAHSSSIKTTTCAVFQEQISGPGRTYTTVARPANPPSAAITPGDALSKIGTSLLGFNADGSLLATRDDSMPTTVWIWDLSELRTMTVLIQHSIIKSLVWHPSNPDLLLIQSDPENSHLYLWDAQLDQPQVLSVPSTIRYSSKVDVQWLKDGADGETRILYSDAQNLTIIYPSGRGSASTTGSQHDGEEDSLFEILSGGRSPNGRSYFDGEDQSAVDDTFRNIKRIGVH